MTERPVMACGCVAQGQFTAFMGKAYDPPRWGCVIHDCLEPMPEKSLPDLTGRKARCGCGAERDSDRSLAFFQYCGAGSREAEELCSCGYTQKAHDLKCEKDPAHLASVCNLFVAKGDRGYDRFYCGCAGWD
jgi:hypothetical protein